MVSNIYVSRYKLDTLGSHLSLEENAEQGRSGDPKCVRIPYIDPFLVGGIALIAAASPGRSSNHGMPHQLANRCSFSASHPRLCARRPRRLRSRIRSFFYSRLGSALPCRRRVWNMTTTPHSCANANFRPATLCASVFLKWAALYVGCLFFCFFRPCPQPRLHA